MVEFGKRHDTTATTDFCRRQLVTDLLYGETGVMDFDHYWDGPDAVPYAIQANSAWPTLRG